MKKNLDANWPMPWGEGDSHYLADYLGGTLTDKVIARIYQVHRGFVVNLRFDSDAKAAQVEEAKLKLLSRVLPLVLARDVKETEPLE